MSEMKLTDIKLASTVLTHLVTKRFRQTASHGPWTSWVTAPVHKSHSKRDASATENKMCQKAEPIGKLQLHAWSVPQPNLEGMCLKLVEKHLTPRVDADSNPIACP